MNIYKALVKENKFTQVILNCDFIACNIKPPLTKKTSTKCLLMIKLKIRVTKLLAVHRVKYLKYL